MNNHKFPNIPRPLTPFQRLQTAVAELIDFNLAVTALCLEKQVFTYEQLFRMEGIIKNARRKLGKDFTIEEGMKAVRAAFRLEDLGGK